MLIYPTPLGLTENAFNHIFTNSFLTSLYKKRSDLQTAIAEYASNPSDVIHFAIWKLASTYLDRWHVLSTRLSNNRKDYCMKYMTLCSWTSPSTGMKVESTVLRLEKIMASITAAFAMYNSAVTTTTPTEAVEYLKIGLYLLRNVTLMEVVLWTTRDESVLPYECTESGVKFYISLFTAVHYVIEAMAEQDPETKGEMYIRAFKQSKLTSITASIREMDTVYSIACSRDSRNQIITMHDAMLSLFVYTQFISTEAVKALSAKEEIPLIDHTKPLLAKCIEAFKDSKVGIMNVIHAHATAIHATCISKRENLINASSFSFPETSTPTPVGELIITRINMIEATRVESRGYETSADAVVPYLNTSKAEIAKLNKHAII
jgi:hypothetical protein